MMKILPNPHRGGRMTRSLVFEVEPGRVYAIDAEKLYQEPRLLDEVAKRSRIAIRALDAAAYLVLIAGVVAAFTVVWWTWLPGVALCAAMLSANRKSAGGIAKVAALRSTQALFYLHSIGVLWVVMG